MSTTAKSLLAAEICAAAERGWPLFPVQAKGKLPLISEWPTKATCDLSALEEWAIQHPGCNWGIATGKPSGVFVVDVDGEAGRASVAELERKGFKLPPTLSVTTGRADGGTHFYFRLPETTDISNDQNGRIGPHIDARGTGGFVVAESSVHATGKVYRCVDPSAKIAEAPAWVIERLTSRTSPQVINTVGSTSAAQAVGKGERTNRLVSLAGTMHKRGMSQPAIEHALLEENAASCVPPLPVEKVRAIALDIPRRYPNNSQEPASKTGLELKDLGELLNKPSVPVDWVIEGRLVAGSVSMFASKPKVGKSTTIRYLALCVARGEQFLGWETKKGEVVYLNLEEREEDVIDAFRAMGATKDDPIKITSKGDVTSLVITLRDRKPVLLIVDPLFRLIAVKDENAYAEVYAHMGPLIDAARETGTHILCSHHSPKQAREDAIDAPLGSTALGGAVSSLFELRRSPESGMRTIRSTQRVGDDLPEMVLHYDPQNRRLSLEGTRQQAEVNILKPLMADALKAAALTEQEILEAVTHGKTGAKRTALRELCRDGAIERLGRGKKGEPFTYRIAKLIENGRLLV